MTGLILRDETSLRNSFRRGTPANCGDDALRLVLVRRFCTDFSHPRRLHALILDTWPFGLNLARSPAIWRRMFETLPSRHFGLNYDPSHLRMQLIDPIEPIQEFGTRIFHTHAKDMRVDFDRLNDVGSLVPPMQRSTAKIPGLGDIDWGKWIGALTDAGYDGPVCVEVEDEAFEGSVERRVQSLKISYNVLRPLIAC